MDSLVDRVLERLTGFCEVSACLTSNVLTLAVYYHVEYPQNEIHSCIKAKRTETLSVIPKKSLEEYETDYNAF